MNMVRNLLIYNHSVSYFTYKYPIKCLLRKDFINQMSVNQLLFHLSICYPILLYLLFPNYYL